MSKPGLIHKLSTRREGGSKSTKMSMSDRSMQFIATNVSVRCQQYQHITCIVSIEQKVNVYFRIRCILWLLKICYKRNKRRYEQNRPECCLNSNKFTQKKKNLYLSPRAQSIRILRTVYK